MYRWVPKTPDAYPACRSCFKRGVAPRHVDDKTCAFHAIGTGGDLPIPVGKLPAEYGFGWPAFNVTVTDWV